MMIGLLDEMTAPGWPPTPGVPFAVDNGRYGKHWFGYDFWWDRLDRFDRELCQFVVAPDIVGDAAATLKDSLPWLPKIRQLGFKVAFVGQDGQENLEVPWDEFDVFFIGGTTDWKLGEHAALLAKEAKDRGKGLHMGRVNTLRRLRIAHGLGCDSVDGTYLRYGPNKNLPKLLTWMLEFI